MGEKEEPKMSDDASPERWQKWHKRWKIRTAHPNLRTNYFQKIDTKEKAYWLGFLYGDGHICDHYGSILIQLKLSRQDESVIDMFCKCLGLEKSRKKRGIDRSTGAEFVGIRFACLKMGVDLLSHGVLFKKTKRTELPTLANRGLELAFLLGYYDADGRQYTTKITSSNHKILEQIKSRYNTSEICIESRPHGDEIRAMSYSVSLGVELFIQMRKNYKHSMPRKLLWFPCTQDEKLRRSREVLTSEGKRIWKQHHARWMRITCDELGMLVQKTSLRQIAARYDVDHRTVAKKCDRLGIPRPEKNYQQKRVSR
ncbi:MAG: hypothetical protein WED04_04320 [Promethearchaeati archaeon SRVP18_Atabeyarchaeia-1]